MRIDGNKGMGTNVGVYVVTEKAFAETRDNDVVRDGGKRSKVCHVPELLVTRCAI